jgi:ABC-type dipeptide/oligopeptide/nickel transport system permease component
MKLDYVIKRISHTLLIFLAVITLNFFIPRIGVDDPAERYYPPQLASMTDSEYEEIKALTREQYGFDASNFEQYIEYVKKLFSGDLGNSFQPGRPKVMALIIERLPWTLVLSVSTMMISATFGILYGTFAANRRGRLPDTALLATSTILTALPSFLLALILSMVLGFWLQWFPGYADSEMMTSFDWSFSEILNVIYNATLPIISMSVGGIVGYSVSTRNSVIIVSNDDYILTARAKGLSDARILYRHTLTNALLPIVTRFMMGLSGLIGGAVVIEKVFNWNGMGTLFINANLNSDYPLMMGIMIFLSSIALLANLTADLLYFVLDPRVQDGGRR